MNAQEFAQVANQLCSDSEYNSEGVYRTIVGRWYYAVYHEVKTWLEIRFSVNFDLLSGGTHEKLVICCNQLQREHIDLGFSRMGRLIGELKDKRVHADYFLKKPFRQFEAEAAKLKFDEINQQLADLKLKYQ